MDFYTGSSTGDGLSLQDMIECDIRSNYSENVPTDHGDVLGSQGSGAELPSPGGAMTLDAFASAATTSEAGLTGMTNLTDVTKFTWVPALNLSHLQNYNPTENSDPNLMVDPQTGVPVSQAELQQTINAVAASQTLTQVNASVNAITTSAQTGLLQTAHGQFITIPAHLQRAYLQQQQQPPSPVQPSSPLRQHLQGIPAQQTQPHSPVRVNTTAYILANNTIQTLPQSPSHKVAHKVSRTEEAPSKTYPKPVYSYSCLIAMALKNSETGCLPVSEIYSFMTENFPYFKTAPDGWKNCVRHNLSLNKCFEKIEPPNTNTPNANVPNKNSVRHNLSLNKCFEKMENPRSNGNTKKGCLWAMNPEKIEKMEEEIAKWRKKDPLAIKRSMAKPEDLDMLEKGQIGCRSPRPPSTPMHIMPSSPAGPPTPTTPKSVPPRVSTPATPTTPSNNNNTKLVVRALPAMAAALAGNNLQTFTVTTPSSSMPSMVAAAQGHTAMEIKQEVLEIKQEDLALNNLTSEDLSILENNLALDPSLCDTELQNSLFDDLGGDDDLLGLDMLPVSMPLSFTLNSASLTASPLTVQAAMPIKEEKFGMSALQTNYIYTNGAVSSAAAAASPKATFEISRALSAHT